VTVTVVAATVMVTGGAVTVLPGASETVIIMVDAEQPLLVVDVPGAELELFDEEAVVETTDPVDVPALLGPPVELLMLLVHE
jgi:hypothetical protein